MSVNVDYEIMIPELGETKMEKAKRNRLETKGWKLGNAKDFLNLAPEDAAYIELKLALCQSLKDHRRRKSLTQVQLARLLDSSQSRVAKMESGDPTVSLDLLIRSLFALGASKKELARVISSSSITTTT